MATQLKFSEFTGGLNLAEATTIKDNELAKAQNVYYDNDDRLGSRRGILNFKQPISDTINVVASMNTFDGDGTWTAGGDAGSVATDATNKKFKSGSVGFTITTVGTTASISNTGITQADLDAVKETGYFAMWVNIAVVTDFTSVTLTLGNTLDTDDYELAVTTQADGSALTTGWNYLKFDWASMTIDGTPDGDIDEIRVTCTYDGAYAGGAIKVDGIIWYSGTYTSGAHSLYHTKLTDGTRVTLAAAGTNLFILQDDNDWALLYDGWTDGEKFSFINYKDVIYFSNGTDNYSYYTPGNEAAASALVTEDASAPKAKYLMIVANTAYAAGISGSKSEVKYSTTLPANLQAAVWTGAEFIYDDDSNEEITGISKLPSDAIAVYLERSSYYVDTVPSTTVIRPLDYDGGCSSFRTISRVGNDTFFLAEDSVYSLAQRQGTSGTFGSSSLSEKIDSLIKSTTNFREANAFRGKRVQPNHYYLNIDTSDSGEPDTCMVLNVKLQAWTEYTNISAYQMIEYEDENGDWHIIYGNVFSGQVREIETGFNDNGVEINVKVWTKEMDFGDPTLNKEVRECDITGFLSQTAEINATDELDGENNATDVIDGDNFATTGTSAITLGTSPIGINPLSGAPIDGESIQLNLFNVRKNIYQAAFRVQIKLESSTADSAWILSKIQFQILALPTDFFANSDYI